MSGPLPHGATPLALWITRHVQAAQGDVDRALVAMADELRDRLDTDPDDAA